jgi:hypothetical protein
MFYKVNVLGIKKYKYIVKNNQNKTNFILVLLFFKIVENPQQNLCFRS